MHPIIMMSMYQEVENSLEETQSWIDTARIAAQANQVVQDALDRQQAHLDTKRALLQMKINSIATRN